MVFKVSTEQRILITLEYTKKEGPENLNNFSLKIRPELKIVNFLVTILQNFCKILDFDRNNSYTHFCFSELLILREIKVSEFSFGPLEYQEKLQIFKKYKKNTIQDPVTQR